MGKSYSVDLRLRVLSALDGGLSKMQAHKTFTISRSTIDDWLTLRKETGHVQVLPKRAGKKGLHEHEAFEDFVVRHQHSTLEQMRGAWHEEREQFVSVMSFSRALRAAGYTRKKRVISTVKGATRKGNSSRNKSNRSQCRIAFIWMRQE
jgi:transposase